MLLTCSRSFSSYSGYTLSASSNENSCKGPITVSRFDFIDVVSTITTDASTSIKTGVTRSYYNTTSVDNAYPIQIRWREVDLAALETHPLSSGVTPTSTENSDAGSNGVGSSRGGGGLSGGAIAGIVIGAVAFVIILCVAVFLLHRKGKSRRLFQRQRVTQAGFPTTSPETTSPRGPSPMPAMDVIPTNPEAVPIGDENADARLRRIAARRARLLELELLDQEEAQLRHQVNSDMPSELSTGLVIPTPVEIGPTKGVLE